MEVGLENTPDEAMWVHFETKPLKFQNLSNSFQARPCFHPSWHCMLLHLNSDSRGIKKVKKYGASLVAQWLRICLLMQETRVRALVWEDPTCHGAVGPVSHSC